MLKKYRSLRTIDLFLNLNKISYSKAEKTCKFVLNKNLLDA